MSKTSKKSQRSRRAFAFFKKPHTIEELRTIYWIRSIAKLAGCAPGAILKSFYINLEKPELNSYSDGRRVPLASTLSAMEMAFPIRNPNDKPFAGTKSLFEVGPAFGSTSFPLWRLLGEKDYAKKMIERFCLSRFGKEWSLMPFDKKLEAIAGLVMNKDGFGDLRPFIEESFGSSFEYVEAMLGLMVELKEMESEFGTLRNSPIGRNLVESPTIEEAAYAVLFREEAYAARIGIREADMVHMIAAKVLASAVPEIEDELYGYFMIRARDPAVLNRFAPWIPGVSDHLYLDE